MISRLAVRMVLTMFIVALTGVLWWTWTADFQNISQRVVVTLVAGSVLLAALSLLFESFLSFGTISVERGSWSYTLFGLYTFDEDRKTPSITARTCELFGVRSVMLSMFSIVAAALLIVLYQGFRTAALFLFNPYVPAVNWHEAFLFVVMIAVVISSVELLVRGQELIEERIRNSAVKAVILALYWSAAFGVFIGTISTLSFFGPGFGDIPIYLAILSAMGVALGLVSVVGVIFGLGYAIYKFVGRMSQRFPALETVWNQFCPIQTVRFR